MDWPAILYALLLTGCVGVAILLWEAARAERPPRVRAARVAPPARRPLPIEQPPARSRRRAA